MQYKAFCFESYRYDRAAATLSLRYRFSGGPQFEEQLKFDFDVRPLSPAEDQVLDRIFRLIFLLSGVSYYKAFIPRALTCDAFSMDRQTAEFLREFYQRGLAEFAFRNGISLDDRCQFQSGLAPPAQPTPLGLPRRTCIPVGGGKDSVVTIETLKRGGEPIVLFSLGDAEPINACIAAAKLPFIRVRRRLDSGLLQLNKAGALNGHIPITGILSAISLACAVMFGFDLIAMSNEHSASAPNITIRNQEINHQYSKSLGFEKRFSDYVGRHISPSITYFSLLRPLSEIEIARRFAQQQSYFEKFRSCNTAFKQQRAERGHHWCCNCPKCRFVFLALAPFLEKQQLIKIFGHNLLDDPAQYGGFAELCGLRAHKPFECVGDTLESAAVVAHLWTRPDWRQDAVVAQLAADFPSLQRSDPAEYRALFEVSHPHRVPEPYMALLDACR